MLSELFSYNCVRFFRFLFNKLKNNYFNYTILYVNCILYRNGPLWLFWDGSLLKRWFFWKSAWIGTKYVFCAKKNDFLLVTQCSCTPRVLRSTILHVYDMNLISCACMCEYAFKDARIKATRSCNVIFLPVLSDIHFIL